MVFNPAQGHIADKTEAFGRLKVKTSSMNISVLSFANHWLFFFGTSVEEADVFRTPRSNANNTMFPYINGT